MTLQQMIENMKTTGLTQAEIARLSGTSPQMIGLILKGRTPRYDIGKNIEHAHKRAMRISRNKNKEMGYEIRS